MFLIGKRQIVTIFLSVLLFLNLFCDKKERVYLETAEKAANWLESVKIVTDQGTTWPVDPNDSTSVVSNLYSGSPGVVLFFLEMYHSTENSKYLTLARSGSDYLTADLPELLNSPEQAGLFTGVAGIGFVLEKTFQATGDQKYRDSALAYLKLIHNSAKETGSGVEWNNITDIISGTAGIGLYLLNAGREMESAESLNLAARAGDRLLELAIEEQSGLKWPMSPDYPRLMPNFSHGTAGVCYFLVSLYEQTKEVKFLESAVAGADYLVNITNDQGLIFHHEPGGEELCYLGWCHGPPGTLKGEPDNLSSRSTSHTKPAGS